MAKPHPDTSFYDVVSSGVVSSGLTLDATVGEEVLSGGVAISNTVDSGGVVIVENGGITRSDIVMSGGTETLSSGAVASGLFVSSGGSVTGTGVICSGTIEGYGVGFAVQSSNELFDIVTVQSGGLVSAVSVGLYGDLALGDGGSASAVVAVAGAITVADGGTLSGVTLSSGAVVLADGGLTEGAKVLAGGEIYLSDASSGMSAVASGVQVANRGAVSVGEGGVLDAVTIHHGGGAEVQSGGTVSRAVVGGGVLTLGVGGEASAVTVTSGGRVEVGYAAYVSGLILQSGSLSAAEFGEVLGFTAASGTTIELEGAIADGADFGYGGRREVAATITGGGILAEQGGGDMVLDGDLSGFTGEVTFYGGTIELDTADEVNAHDVAFGHISTTDNTLQLDEPDQPATGTTFAPTMSNWTSATDRIDLAGRAFVSGATATVRGGVLTLKDGPYTAKFTLGGQHATHYVVQDDGKGGTLIHAGAGSTIVNAQPAAGAALRQAAAGFGAAPAAATPAVAIDREPALSLLAAAAPSRLHR